MGKSKPLGDDMVPTDKSRLLLLLPFFLFILFWSTDSLAAYTACTSDAECGVGTCSNSFQCTCPPGYVNAPEMPCVKQMKRKDHQKPFLLELFFGWVFPAGFAHEDLWQLAGIRLGIESVAALLSGGYWYSKHHTGSTALGTNDIEMDILSAGKATVPQPPATATKTSSKLTRFLGASAIAATSLHGVAWIINTALFGELEWPDPNFKKFLHLDKDQHADLVIIGSKIAESAYVTLENFPTDSCALKEGCVGGSGERRLLRFDSYIYNIGDGDFVFAFENIVPVWSSCHQHFHAPEATAYFLKQELFNNTNSSVAVRYGHKQGYCFRDTVKISQNYTSKFGCGIPKMTRQYTQGITAGLADIYPKTLDCQWIDITDIAPGTYRLVLTVNPHGVYYQDKPENNLTIVEVIIPAIDEISERTKAGVVVQAKVIKEYDEND